MQKVSRVQKVWKSRAMPHPTRNHVLNVEHVRTEQRGNETHYLVTYDNEEASMDGRVKSILVLCFVCCIMNQLKKASERPKSYVKSTD